MAKRYRMTAKRRAALRKAQLASAKKRRRRNIAVGAAGVSVVAVTVGAGFVGHRYVNALKGGPKAPTVVSTTSKELDLIRVVPVRGRSGQIYGLGPMTGVPKSQLKKVGAGKATQRAIDRFDRAARQAAKNRVQRPRRNSRRRRQRLAGMPVAGHMTPPISTKGSKAAARKRKARRRRK